MSNANKSHSDSIFVFGASRAPSLQPGPAPRKTDPRVSDLRLLRDPKFGPKSIPNLSKLGPNRTIFNNPSNFVMSEPQLVMSKPEFVMSEIIRKAPSFFYAQARFFLLL